MTSNTIETNVARAHETGDYSVITETLQRPPYTPGTTPPYYALCWTDMAWGEWGPLCHDVYTRPVHGDNPVSVIRESLDTLGLPDLKDDYEAFIKLVWLTGYKDEDTKTSITGGSSSTHVRAAAVDPSQFKDYRLAVMPFERGFIWAHRVDKKDKGAHHRRWRAAGP